MTVLFAICAVIGGTIMVCQFVMTLIGLGHDADIATDLPDDLPHDVGGGSDHAGHGHDVAEADHGSTWFFGVLTFRTIVAALAFFGLAGLAAQSNETSNGTALIIALSAGIAAMYGVHWMMQALYKLRAEGNVRIERAVGHTGTVYLKIPGQRRGAGKIQLNLQNRTVELEALTRHEDIPTGARIVVTGIVGPDTVEVEPVNEGIAHA